MENKFSKFLISLYKPVKKLTVIMIGSMIIAQILDILKQYIIKGIIDLPSKENFQLSDLYNVIFILAALIVINLVFFYISSIVRTIYIKRKQTVYITEKLFNNLDKKTYPFFADNYSGKISSSISEINREIVSLNERLTTKFVSILTSIITSLVILYTINFNIFITTTILFGGIIITRVIYFSKIYLPLIKKSQEHNREYKGILNDAVLNFTSLKIYNAIDSFSKTLKAKKEEFLYYRNKASSKEYSFGAFANIVYVIVFAMLMTYCIKLFEMDLMSLGNFVFFINTMISLKNKTTDFTWAYIHIGESLVKIKQCYDLLYIDNNVIDDNKEDIIISSGKVEYKDISFKYNTNNIFEKFDLLVEDKQKIGIIGVSGSGKTTLVNLLFKFYSPQRGMILIDDKDISNYNTKSLYKNLTYVPQETILLHASIFENIKIAKPDATYDEIIKAAKKAELSSFIETLDNKYDTIVGERGIKLSGGQRQRIALARIFLRDSKIVIFDEATSSLDNNTEFKIQKNINKYFKNQTIICIAHRLSTLKDMNKIVVIEKGKIIDSGTPQEIIPKYENKEFLVEDI